MWVQTYLTELNIFLFPVKLALIILGILAILKPNINSMELSVWLVGESGLGACQGREYLLSPLLILLKL